MDTQEREKLLAQIPTPDLRKAAFEKLGRGKSVELMLEHQGQLEQIRAAADTQVSAGPIYVRAAAIGALAGAGMASLLVLSGNKDAAEPSVEIISNGIAFLGFGGLGAIAGRAFAGLAVESKKSKFIWKREDLIQKQHREFLIEQLTNSQLEILFLQIAAEE